MCKTLTAGTPRRPKGKARPAPAFAPDPAPCNCGECRGWFLPPGSDTPVPVCLTCTRYGTDPFPREIAGRPQWVALLLRMDAVLNAAKNAADDFLTAFGYESDATLGTPGHKLDQASNTVRKVAGLRWWLDTYDFCGTTDFTSPFTDDGPAGKGVAGV